MRIIHIEDFVHPDAGYQVNILSKFMAKQGNEVYIVTGEMDKMPESLTSFFDVSEIKQKDTAFYEQTGVRFIRVPLKAYISGRAVYESCIFDIVDNLNPDILFVHGNDTLIGIQYALRANKLKYPLIFDSHMLKMASKNKLSALFHILYRFVVAPIIRRNEIIVIRTQDDDYVERYLGIPLSQCPWISFGSDTILFHENLYNYDTFRAQYDIGKDAFVCIYAGKIDDSKGGLFLAEAFKDSFNTNREIVLVLVGNLNTAYGVEVKKALEKSNNKVLLFPTQKYSDLAKFYQIADVAVFPKQCSLSFFDVQACGLPVVFEDNNINIDRATHNNALVFKGNDVDDFREKILYYANMSKQDFVLCKNAAKEYILKDYNYEEITKKYMQQIMSTIERWRAKKYGKENTF